MTTDGERVFWTSEDAVWAAPITGGKTEPLAVGQAKPASIAVDDLWVYWTSDDTGEIFKVAK